MTQERVTGRLIERSFAVGAEADLHVNNVRGSVRVTGAEGPEIRLRIEVDPEGRLTDDDLARAPIELIQEGNRLNVKVLSDQAIMGWFERRSGPPTVRMSLEAPLRTRVNISCVSADVALGGVSGAQAINTVSGNIVATDMQGDVKLNTVSGDALLTRSSGAVRWNSVSGSLTVREGQTSGISSNSVSGSVEASVEGALQDGVQAQSVSGDLRLRVPSGFGCDAMLSSMSGNARCGLPVQVVESRRGRWHGAVNGGGPPVRLSSMSGSLVISDAAAIGTEEAFPSGKSSFPGGMFGPRPETAARPQPAPTQAVDARARILQQVERKEITIEEGLARLDALRGSGARTERGL